MDLDAQKRRCIERIVGKLDIYFLHDTRKAANELYALQSSIDERDVATLQDKKAPLFEKAAARKRLAAKEILWDEKASLQSKKIAQETLGEYQPKLAYALEVFEHLKAALGRRDRHQQIDEKHLYLHLKKGEAAQVEGFTGYCAKRVLVKASFLTLAEGSRLIYDGTLIGKIPPGDYTARMLANEITTNSGHRLTAIVVNNDTGIIRIRHSPTSSFFITPPLGEMLKKRNSSQSEKTFAVERPWVFDPKFFIQDEKTLSLCDEQKQTVDIRVMDRYHIYPIPQPICLRVNANSLLLKDVATPPGIDFMLAEILFITPAQEGSKNNSPENPLSIQK